MAHGLSLNKNIFKFIETCVVYFSFFAPFQKQQKIQTASKLRGQVATNSNNNKNNKVDKNGQRSVEVTNGFTSKNTKSSYTFNCYFNCLDLVSVERKTCW